MAECSKETSVYCQQHLVINNRCGQLLLTVDEQLLPDDHTQESRIPHHGRDCEGPSASAEICFTS